MYVGSSHIIYEHLLTNNPYDFGYGRSSFLILQGQFKNGECNGPALITLPDGSHGNPRCEGVYRGSVCERRCEAGDAVRRARQAQNISRTISTDLSSQ